MSKAILGIGIDILAIERIERLLLKFPSRFAQKILNTEELDEWKSKGGRASSFAKIFAIKESVAKAVSNTKNATWHNITTGHDEYGRPTVKLSGALLKNLKSDDFNVFVSISDEKEYVIAYVIIEGVRHINVY
jgi:holo-[acyl-carrier protein] synthase